MAELKRTGAFERKVLMVATTTGSGWLEAQGLDSIEYLPGGGTAIVATQYSYLPSWVSFLFNEQLPVDASSELFNAVHAEWASMPEGKHPRLAVYGLSLGAFGLQGVLGDLERIRAMTDAALFTGPPNNSQPWGGLQDHRDAGSPVWQPIYQGGGGSLDVQARGLRYARWYLARTVHGPPAARDRRHHLARCTHHLPAPRMAGRNPCRGRPGS
ncbi:hypothetical protein GCM10023166_34150 [Paeniglutamicibacter cryotolerans]|uniref:Putative membrane protein n=1 Tax=Paeniglutamicibacter cryotolerans TaxID=670079 RepID=A0A839QM54_9MICC|nr:putative membrane protein [Paeniglutamicibacter cryotolerans]